MRKSGKAVTFFIDSPSANYAYWVSEEDQHLAPGPHKPQEQRREGADTAGSLEKSTEVGGMLYGFRIPPPVAGAYRSCHTVSTTYTPVSVTRGPNMRGARERR